jgi:hypothetical protein
VLTVLFADDLALVNDLDLAIGSPTGDRLEPGLLRCIRVQPFYVVLELRHEVQRRNDRYGPKHEDESKEELVSAKTHWESFADGT